MQFDRAKNEKPDGGIRTKLWPVDGPVSTGDGTARGGSFADAIRRAGYGRKSQPYAQVPFATLKGATFDEYGSLDDFGPQRFLGAELGHDQRYLWTALPQVAVDAGTTSVQSFRQVGRTLADPSDMLRDIDATSAKPETDTAAEVVSVSMQQIATVSSGIANVLLESQDFRRYVNGDLRLAHSEAIDAHVLTEIAAASPDSASGGDNPVEQLLYAAEAVIANGYSPNIAVLSPADGLALRLAMLRNGDSYIRTPELPLRIVVAKSAAAGYVMDTRAVGTLYLSPVTFATFEENAGATNSSTVRVENHGVFLTQRVSAVVEVGPFGS